MSKEDLSLAREVSKNITEEKINGFIRETQLVEVRGFLGEELYLKLQKSFDGSTFDEQRFIDLWEGVDYTAKDVEIRYYGLKMYCVYICYNRILIQQQTNVSRFGVESVQNEISEDQSAGAVRGKAKEAISLAMEYLEGAKKYLYNEGSTYPEYRDNSHPANPASTAFKFFRV